MFSTFFVAPKTNKTSWRGQFLHQLRQRVACLFLRSRGNQMWQPLSGVSLSFTELCSGSESVSYLRLIDTQITRLEAQGLSKTCNERKEGGEEEKFLERSRLTPMQESGWIASNGSHLS